MKIVHETAIKATMANVRNDSLRISDAEYINEIERLALFGLKVEQMCYHGLIVTLGEEVKRLYDEGVK